MNFNYTLDKMLDAVAGAMVEAETAAPARAAVTLPAALANDVFRLLGEARDDAGTELRRVGEALAAGDCASCKVTFFDDFFGNAAHDAPRLAEFRTFARDTFKAFAAACEARPGASVAAPEIGAEPPAADFDAFTTAMLRAEYHRLGDALDLLDPDLDAHGPHFVAYARRARTIERELLRREQSIPFATSQLIKSELAGRRTVLCAEWNGLAAELADIDARTINRHPTRADAQTHHEAIRRIADIKRDIEALTGRAAEPLKDRKPATRSSAEDLLAFAKAGGPIVDRFHNPQPGDRNTRAAKGGAQ